jgi:hypothetical protein
MIQKIFLFSNTSRPSLGSPQASYSLGEGRLSGVKRPGRDGDHLRPSRAEVKNGMNPNSNPPMCFQSVDRDFLYVNKM